MYCLSVIHSLNRKAVSKASSNAVANRDCSFVSSRKGIVLHSAAHRDTTFISGRSVGPVLSRLKRLQSKGHRQALNQYIENLCNRTR